MDEIRVIEDDSYCARCRLLARKPCFILGVLFGCFVLALVVTLIVIFTDDSSRGDDVLISDERDLWLLDLDGSSSHGFRNRSIVARSFSGIGAFAVMLQLQQEGSGGGRSQFVAEPPCIFWRANNSSWIESLCPRYAANRYSVPRDWDPVALAVDHLAENLYALDGRASTLLIFDLKGRGYGLALADLTRPADLALDSASGWIFILQRSDSILKAQMDGSGAERVVIDPSLAAMALDRHNRLIYYADSVQIARCDYYGRGRQVIAKLSSETTSLAVVPRANRLLFTRTLQASGHRRSLWSCTIASPSSSSSSSGGSSSVSPGVCEETRQIDFEEPRLIRVSSSQVDPRLPANPCGRANGGCQQLCLLRRNGGRSCACYIGHRLGPDLMSCERLSDYLLYVRGDFARGRVLPDDHRSAAAAGEAFTDALLPIEIHPLVRKGGRRQLVDFDYDYNSSRMAFSDEASLHLVNLEQSQSQQQQQQITYVMAGRKCVRGLAYDWITGDVYHILDNQCGLQPQQQQDSTNVGHEIAVMRPTTTIGQLSTTRRHLIKTLRSFGVNRGQVVSIALDPNRAYYFFTVLFKGQAYIYRSHGTRVEYVREWRDVNETGLACDRHEARLYWLGRNGSRVYHAQYDGSDPQSFDLRLDHDDHDVDGGAFRSLTVGERHVYAASLGGVWRFDKRTGHAGLKLLPVHEEGVAEPIAGVKLYAASSQPVARDNACALNNGGCRQFCIRTPVMVSNRPGNSVNVTTDVKELCLCEDGKNIMNDGKSCA
ncbi:low-density lipoprotein receptor-related protein 2-like [Trichogramma pretiosum]|uniref:low-density lipoprotein receptor-related protein 2-like n=1 Tax=Trichogramma pretiosum TaxID=7493 RepID=UPI0006C99A82|nr:low-density lipoprotein receptor-related protein 2-like [Trichogramma pretiosum]